MREIEFYFTPDFSKLFNPFVWKGAFGQAFFSLSVVVGIRLTYGSYMGEEGIVKSAVVITIADLLVAILSGVVISPIVFSFRLDPAMGVKLAFVTLPPIFQKMSFGSFWGGFFYFFSLRL